MFFHSIGRMKSFWILKNLTNIPLKMHLMRLNKGFPLREGFFIGCPTSLIRGRLLRRLRPEGRQREKSVFPPKERRKRDGGFLIYVNIYVVFPKLPRGFSAPREPGKTKNAMQEQYSYTAQETSFSCDTSTEKL